MTDNRDNPTNPCQNFYFFFTRALTSAGLVVSPTCTKPSVCQVGHQVGPGTAGDGTALGLGQVPSARYLLVGAAGEAFPTELFPGSAAVSVCLCGPVLGSMWTSG